MAEPNAMDRLSAAFKAYEQEFKSKGLSVPKEIDFQFFKGIEKHVSSDRDKMVLAIIRTSCDHCSTVT